MKVVRPKNVSPERRKEITRYLHQQWQRAKDGRTQQVDADYDRWDKNYRSVPLEKTRSVPWYNASNLVVPVIRIFHDTLVSRILGIVFGTNPLVKIIGYPDDQAEPLERYLNYKALHQWGMYSVADQWLNEGNKNGTSILKTPWVEEEAVDVQEGKDGSEWVEEDVQIYQGPRPAVIPYEDFYIYPITASQDHQVQIRFHRLRFVEEEVRQMCDEGKWLQPFDGEKGLKKLLKQPTDIKRGNEQQDAGASDSYLFELQPVECHFRTDLLGNGKYYDVVALLLEDSPDDLLDLYFNPYPRNVCVFHDFRPYRRTGGGLWFGESLCQMLEQIQEEVSTIHNDRRNNSYIANAPMFKMKGGIGIPNPSSRWYPGKVWTVDSMDDFEAVSIGSAYDSMLDQESWAFQLAERLTGISAPMQAAGAGAMGKRGTYSTGGTMAILSEGNERQNTAIRRFREALGGVLKTCFILQKSFVGAEDPALAFFADTEQAQIRQALSYTSQSDRLWFCPFEVQTSTSTMNKEVDRQNLMQMVGVISQYYQQVIQMGQQLLDPKLNPGLRMLFNDIIQGQQAIAKRLLRAFDQMDPEGMLPNVRAAVEKAVPGGSAGSRAQAGMAGQPPLLGGGNPSGPEPDSRAGLESLLQIPTGGSAFGGGKAA